MLLLGFKRQFEAAVLQGTKTHTIRRLKRHPPKVGEICHCYGDVRQKTMHLLGRWPCIAVDDILIKPVMVPNWKSLGLDKPMIVTLEVFINGEKLSTDETEALFYRDGFRDVPPAYTSTAMARDFWRDNFKDGEPFVGQMIHWNFEEPVNGRLPDKPRRNAAGRKVRVRSRKGGARDAGENMRAMPVPGVRAQRGES